MTTYEIDSGHEVLVRRGAGPGDSRTVILGVFLHAAGEGVAAELDLDTATDVIPDDHPDGDDRGWDRRRDEADEVLR